MFAVHVGVEYVAIFDETALDWSTTGYYNPVKFQWKWPYNLRGRVPQTWAKIAKSSYLACLGELRPQRRSQEMFVATSKLRQIASEGV